MSQTYHVNPTSGEASKCRASVKPCPFGGDSGTENHYDSMEEARTAYENSQEQSLISYKDTSVHNANTVITLNGRSIKTVGTVQPPEKRAQELRDSGRSAPTLYEISPEDADAFEDQVQKLKNGNKFHASVYVYPVDEYKDMRMFMSEDGESGVALKSDGDIVSVFSSANAKEPRAANSMIATAVSLGGNKLDCFDTVLPKIYAEEGFVEVGRDSWAEEYKPEGWEYDTYAKYNNGRPDVVYMEHRG